MENNRTAVEAGVELIAFQGTAIAVTPNPRKPLPTVIVELPQAPGSVVASFNSSAILLSFSQNSMGTTA